MQFIPYHVYFSENRQISRTKLRQPFKSPVSISEKAFLSAHRRFCLSRFKSMFNDNHSKHTLGNF